MLDDRTMLLDLLRPVPTDAVSIELIVEALVPNVLSLPRKRLNVVLIDSTERLAMFTKPPESRAMSPIAPAGCSHPTGEGERRRF